MKTRVSLKYFVNDCGYQIERKDCNGNKGELLLYIGEDLPVVIIQKI